MKMPQRVSRARARSTIGISLAVAGVFAACIIPDHDIEVVNSCGEEWVAQTVGAYGYNGLGEKENILTRELEWVSQSYCVTQAQHDVLSDIEGPLAAELVAGAITDCQERAVALGLGDEDDTCTSSADIAWVGSCSLDQGCGEPSRGDDEAEGGTDESGTGSESETDSGEEMTSETDALGLPPEAG